MHTAQATLQRSMHRRMAVLFLIVPSRSYQVAALRLYTTAAYSSMNGPLRDDDRYQRGQACPLPVATQFAVQGIKKLRGMHVNSDKQVGNPRELYTESSQNGLRLGRSNTLVDQNTLSFQFYNDTQVHDGCLSVIFILFHYCLTI